MRILLATVVICAAHASYATCNVDIDCMDPGGNYCGGMVCKWGTTGHVCVPAGTDAQGMDGWCGAPSDCKCQAQGATCVGHFCKFTLPPVDMAGAISDMAGAPPADLSAPAGSDLAVPASADLSVPADLSTPGSTPTKK